MHKLVIGNWKMWGAADQARALASGIAAGAGQGAEVVVCPPFIHLGVVAAELQGSNIALGAQTCAPKAEGALTGEISGTMLKDMGCTYVIVGHSERRQYLHEIDADVLARAECAHQVGLAAIICVGETAEDRQTGQAFDVVRAQLAASLPRTAMAENTVIAYEPVWAIGTGAIPSESDISAMHVLIRGIVEEKLAKSNAPRIVYGGSVTPENAAGVLSIPGVDGVLVGRACLTANGFLAMTRIAAGEEG